MLQHGCTLETVNCVNKARQKWVYIVYSIYMKCTVQGDPKRQRGDEVSIFQGMGGKGVLDRLLTSMDFFLEKNVKLDNSDGLRA